MAKSDDSGEEVGAGAMWNFDFNIGQHARRRRSWQLCLHLWRAGQGANALPQTSCGAPSKATLLVIGGVRSDGSGNGAPMAQTSTCGRNNTMFMKTLKTNVWSDESLENALNAITNEGLSLREASRVFGIPTSSIQDHLYGRTTSRQRGIMPTSKAHEEKQFVDYVFKMQDLGHRLTPIELRLKVAIATQTRAILWSAFGVLRKGWLCRFYNR